MTNLCIETIFLKPYYTLIVKLRFFTEVYKLPFPKYVKPSTASGTTSKQAPTEELPKLENWFQASEPNFPLMEKKYTISHQH